MKNKLIVFEGIDGVGKTTLAKKLQEALVSRGIPAVSFEQFEDKEAGYNKIKKFIKNETPIDASLFFYLSSAIYKSVKIEKMLEKSWVICDRYIYSTLSYHKIRQADLSLVANLDKLPILAPDHLFLVHVNENIRHARTLARGECTPEDLVRKRAGNLVEKMENTLNEFHPVIIDNSGDGLDRSLLQILDCCLGKQVVRDNNGERHKATSRG